MQPSDQESRSCYSANTLLLSLSKSQLAHEISYRGTPYDQVLHAARDTNATIRRHYSDFIQQVGRNIYPLIIASDYETDGHSGGVGSTLTLYKADGSIITKSPALGTFYEVYKTCSHLFMGLSVELGPYLSNSCSSSGECDQVDEAAGCSDSCECATAATCTNESLLSSTLEGTADEKEDDNALSFPPWESSMKEFVTKAQILSQSIVRMTAAAAAATMETTSSNSSSKCPHHHNHHTTTTSSPPFSLPPPEMRDILLSMLSSIIQFCNTCLSTKMLHIAKWEELNRENFPRIKRCMIEATTLQANLCIRQIMDWRDNTLTEEEWKELYVVIPTVWAVDKENPRKEMFRQLMSPGRAETHLITSEYPRNHEEARTLLGRIVGDRAIGHFVFGNASSMEQIKTVGLSSQIDVTQDDALPAICNALKELNNTKKCDEQIK